VLDTLSKQVAIIRREIDKINKREECVCIFHISYTTRARGMTAVLYILHTLYMIMIITYNVCNI
jgi:hypothetical protein